MARFAVPFFAARRKRFSSTMTTSGESALTVTKGVRSRTEPSAYFPVTTSCCKLRGPFNVTAAGCTTKLVGWPIILTRSLADKRTGTSAGAEALKRNRPPTANNTPAARKTLRPRGEKANIMKSPVDHGGEYGGNEQAALPAARRRLL